MTPIFEKNVIRVLIVGEGGAGKTSLACKLAKWAISKSSLSKHKMIPVLIEDELHTGEKGNKLITAISAQLRDLIGSGNKLNNDFLLELMRQRRVLVIIDHYSEFSEDTKAEINPGSDSFPINALIITSRNEENFKNSTKNLIKPIRIEGSQIPKFIEDYLDVCNKRNLFTQTEYLEACYRLSLMAGERHMTVLFVKLFADQMIANKETGSSSTFASNIPELVTRYVNKLNSNIKDTKLSSIDVLQSCKSVAWECVKHNYIPQTALRKNILEALGDARGAEILQYLIGRLHIIQKVSEDGERLRFTLDPVAEYLAALHLIETNGRDDKKWQSFLKDFDSKNIGGNGTEGYLGTLLECYLYKQQDLSLSEQVFNALNERKLSCKSSNFSNVDTNIGN